MGVVSGLTLTVAGARSVTLPAPVPISSDEEGKVQHISARQAGAPPELAA